MSHCGVSDPVRVPPCGVWIAPGQLGVGGQRQGGARRRRVVAACRPAQKPRHPRKPTHTNPCGSCVGGMRPPPPRPPGPGAAVSVMTAGEPQPSQDKQIRSCGLVAPPLASCTVSGTGHHRTMGAQRGIPIAKPAMPCSASGVLNTRSVEMTRRSTRLTWGRAWPRNVTRATECLQMCARNQGSFRRGEGGGFGTQKCVYQKWPNRIFPIVNFVFSHDGHFGLGGRGPPPLLRCTAILILPCPRTLRHCGAHPT